MIIYGHPCLGKTYAKQKGLDFIDWDDEFNHLRDAFLKENGLTKETMWKDHNFLKFVIVHWKRVREKAKDKILFASPSNLLVIFPKDFDLIIDIPAEEFIARNMERGGTFMDSHNWKVDIDRHIKTALILHKIPKVTVAESVYLTDLYEENCFYFDEHSNARFVFGKLLSGGTNRNSSTI